MKIADALAETGSLFADIRREASGAGLATASRRMRDITADGGPVRNTDHGSPALRAAREAFGDRSILSLAVTSDEDSRRFLAVNTMRPEGSDLAAYRIFYPMDDEGRLSGDPEVRGKAVLARQASVQMLSREEGGSIEDVRMALSRAATLADLSENSPRRMRSEAGMHLGSRKGVLSGVYQSVESRKAGRDGKRAEGGTGVVRMLSYKSGKEVEKSEFLHDRKLGIAARIAADRVLNVGAGARQAYLSARDIEDTTGIAGGSPKLPGHMDVPFLRVGDASGNFGAPGFSEQEKPRAEKVVKLPSREETTGRPASSMLNPKLNGGESVGRRVNGWSREKVEEFGRVAGMRFPTGSAAGERTSSGNRSAGRLSGDDQIQ